MMIPLNSPKNLLFFQKFHTVVDCGLLEAPENGVININTTTFNSIATYGCDSGFEVNGIQTRTCGASGNWSDSEPACISKPRLYALKIISL